MTIDEIKRQIFIDSEEVCGNTMIDIYIYQAEEYVEQAYNKAIDDFVKEICKMIVQSENNGNYKFYAVEIKQAIADLAEQLKAGEVDG